ncbi:MCE family protein [Mycobacterium sp. 1274761.0]|uniref:MCE family protein n=1 Tax=Mycobacterium sp. 1274761.0 TaxID=1834077 RepID=UPI00350F6E51
MALRFGAFAIVTVLLTGCLFLIFGEFRGGSTRGYSAVFTDASSLKAGDSVRVAGVRVGTVDSVTLRDDSTVVVSFDADDDVVMTTGSRAAVRYLNLVGDRYLELLDGPGPAQTLPRGSQIPVDRTQPALDLDLLLGGLKPVIRGLDPRDVNALTEALLQIFQGQGDTLQSLLNRTSSFSNTLADNNSALQSLVDNLDTVLATLGEQGQKFSGALDKFERLTTELAADRDTIGAAIDSLSAGTASVADLLSNARSPLAGTVDQLNRVAPLLDKDKDLIEKSIQRAPENYRKLARVGSYGSFVNYYLCGVSVRVSDLQGRTAVFPFIKQRDGRCAEPDE